MQTTAVSNRAKKAKLTTTYSGPILQYLRQVEGDFQVLDDEAFAEVFQAAQLGDLADSEDCGKGMAFALFADPKLECALWNADNLDVFGFAHYRITSFELQEGILDPDDSNLGVLHNSDENGFRLKATLLNFDSIPEKRRGVPHASEVFPETLIWKDLKLEDHVLLVREDVLAVETAAKEGGKRATSSSRKEVDDEETSAASKGKFIVSAGKSFLCSTEASVKLKRKLDDSVFPRRVINRERQEVVFREDGTVFVPEGEYLHKLTLIASQRAIGVDSAGATAVCWAGVESLRLVQKLKLFQPRSAVTFDSFMRGERWPILDYQQMSLDAFLPVQDSKVDYSDMGQLIHKLSGLEMVLSIGGGFEWKGCTADIIEELTTGRLMSSRAEALHYRTNEAISIFVDTVKNPELEVVTRKAQDGKPREFNLNAIEQVVAFFKNCLASVQEDDFKNVHLFSEVIRPTLTMCSISKPTVASSSKSQGVLGKGAAPKVPAKDGGNRVKKRVRDTESQGGQNRICINNALYYLQECSTDCSQGSTCPYLHFTEGSSIVKAPIHEVIQMARRLPPFGRKKEQLLEALNKLAEDDADEP